MTARPSPEDLADLRRRLGQVQFEVQDLARRIDRLETAGHAAAAPDAISALSAGEEDLVEAVVVAPPGAMSKPAAPSGVASPSSTLRPAPAGPQTSGLDLESAIGTRLLTWAGGLVLLFAVGFGVHWWWTTFSVPPELQATGLHLLGLGLIVGGVLASRRLELPLLGHGLAGVGVFTLYAAALATLRLYQLSSESAAFTEFVAITLGATALACWLRNPLVILLGALGGYLAPVLTTTEAGSHVALFLYLAALNGALLLTAVLMRWPWLKPITFLATAGYFFLWFASDYSEVHRTSTAWLLALHAALLWLSAAGPALLTGRPSTFFDQATVSAAAISFLIALWGMYHEVPDQHLGLVAWCLAAGHGLACQAARRRLSDEPEDRLVRVLLALTAVFLVWAVPLSLDDWRYLGLLWCAEGLVFTWVAVHYHDGQFRAAGLAALALGLARILGADYLPAGQAPPDAWLTYRPWWTMLGGAVLTALAGSASWWMPGKGALSERQQATNRALGAVLLASANVMLLLALTCLWRDRTLLMLWTLDTALLWAAGFALGRAPVRWYASGVAALGCGLLALSLGDRVTEPFRLIGNDRFASLALLALAWGGAGWCYARLPSQGPPAGSPNTERYLHVVWGLAAHLVLVFAMSLEIHGWFRQAQATGEHPFANMRMAELASYSILWAVYAAGLVAAGFATRYPLYRLLGLVSFGPILLKVFLVDLAQLELLPRVLAFSVLGVMLLGTSVLYQRFAVRAARQTAVASQADS